MIPRHSGPSFPRLLLLSCLVSFAAFFSSYMRIPVLPLFAASLGADTLQVGAINACFLFAAGSLSIPFGLVSDRTGRRPLMLIGLSVLAASSFLLCLAKSPGQMMAIYLLFGVGMAAFGPSMMSYVSDFTPSTHVGRAYGWYTMAIYGGMALGPAAGGFLGHMVGLRQVFPVAGVITAGVILLVQFALPPVSPPKSGGMIVSASTLLELLRLRGYMAALLATFGSCFGFGAFITFFPLFGRSQGMTAGAIGLVIAAQAVANTAARLPFGYLSDRIHNRSILITWGLAIFGTSLLLLAWCGSSVAFAATAVCLGTGMGIAYTAIGGLIAESVPPTLRGLAMGGYSSCIYFGMMISSAVMGGVIEAVGFTGGFVATGAVTLLLTLAFNLLMRAGPES